MTSAEFSEWAAYASLEPFGFHMDNFRMGQVAATAWNAARRSRKPLVAADFYPDLAPSRKVKMSTEADQQAFFMALANATGGGIHGKRRRTVTD